MFFTASQQKKIAGSGVASADKEGVLIIFFINI
jgi:hypothetical protein